MKMKKLYFIPIIIFSIVLLINGCGNKENKNKPVELDIPVPENNLTEIKIGEQIWAAKNLEVIKFNNGDSIPEATTEKEWEQYGKEGKPAWCYFNNNPEQGKKYGKLYNGFAVFDSRGIAPSGWHIATDEEWTILTNYLGGDQVGGTKMKAKGGWLENGNGSNESNFSALPGGSCRSSGTFDPISQNANWWSSTEGNKDNAWARSLNYNYGNIYRDYHFKSNGFSVRCIMN